MAESMLWIKRKCHGLTMTTNITMIRERQIFVWGADTNMLAIHGPITNVSKIFKSFYLLHYQKYKAVAADTPVA